MTTTPAHPTTFGFETGVVPPEFTGTPSATAYPPIVVDVSSLPGQLPSGTTSPKAMRLRGPEGGSTGFITVPINFNGTGQVRFKVGIVGPGQISVFSNTSGIYSASGAMSWNQAVYNTSGGSLSLEFDYSRANGETALFDIYITDIELVPDFPSADTYIAIAATTSVDTGGSGGGSGTGGPVTYDFSDGAIPSAFTVSSGNGGLASVVDPTQFPNLGTAPTSKVLRLSGEYSASAFASVTWTFTLADVGTLSYDRAVESEQNWDFGSLTIDGTRAWSLSGDLPSHPEQKWAHFSHDLAAGEHTVTFQYAKDGGGDTGYDALFLANMVIDPVEGAAPAGPLTLVNRVSLLATRIAKEFKSVRTALGLKAPIDSPAFTGTPTAPTPAAGDSSTTLATTQFVTTADGQRLVWRGAWSAQTAYVLNDIVQSGNITYVCKTAHTSGNSFSATNWTVMGYASMASYATLASPTFTGDPKAPTPASTDNDTSIATTAFVQTAAGTRMRFRGVWAASTAYVVNDIVISGGVLYLAYAAHTSGTTFSVTNWTTLAQVDMSAYATTASLSSKADLVAGVVPTSQLPSIALTNVVTVASQAAMLALTSSQVQPGDVAARTDGAGTFMLTATDPSVLANWVLLNAPTDKVVSVNAQTGTVVLGKADVGLGNVDNTSDANKPLSTAATNALALKAPLASPAFTGDPTVPDPAAGDNDFSIANTGWVSRLVGAPADWVAQFQAALNAVPAGATAASKTVPGIVQLGTAAEALAGLDDAHAITALSLAGVESANKRVYKVTSLGALCDLGDTLAAAGRDNGEIAVLINAPVGATGSGYRINQAMYFWYSGIWFPYGVIYMGSTAPATNDGTPDQYLAAVAALPNKARHNIAEGARLNSRHVMYEWVPEGVFLARSEQLLSDWQFFTSGYTVVPWDASFVTEQRILESGRQGQLTIGVRKSDTSNFAAGNVLLTLNSGRPKRQYNGVFAGYGSGSGWNQGPVPISIGTDGKVTLNSVPTGVQGIFGTFQYPLT